ncbi:hypothetical protein HRbin02_00790 [Candidatus Calditenuaceae archaeon HR02]|nr:hypothetical protein HRbin02_00790 [Candidatus Calditenuaceae archaeon HR02]
MRWSRNTRRRICDAVLDRLGISDAVLARVMHDAWTFGLIRMSQQGIVLTHLGRTLQSLLQSLLESRTPVPESTDQIWMYMIHNVVCYAILKFPKKLSKISQRMRDNPQGLERVKRMVEENVTFADILACFTVYIGLELPEWLREETLSKLEDLGMMSWRGKIRPFGKALAMCFLDYLKDSSIINEDRMPTLSEWSRMLGLS